jgi:hypothetical protein
MILLLDNPSFTFMSHYHYSYYSHHHHFGYILYNWVKTVNIWLFSGGGFKLKALNLQGRLSTTWATPLAWQLSELGLSCSTW